MTPISQSSIPSGPLAAPRGGSGAMFDRIARRYDLLNRLLSLGLDGRWRRRAVRALELPPGARVLDLATGTADVALEIVRARQDATVVGLDPSPRMLEVGRGKLEERGVVGRVELREGDAEQLPFEADAFDGVAIAFGIRNVPDRRRALAEMARVCRAEGRVALLELCEPPPGPLGWLARLYVHGLVPRLGAWLSGAREYRYLEESIAAFPPPAAFGRLMAESGLEVLAIEKLCFGVCCLFVARPAGGGA